MPAAYRQSTEVVEKLRGILHQTFERAAEAGQSSRNAFDLARALVSERVGLQEATTIVRRGPHDAETLTREASLLVLRDPDLLRQAGSSRAQLLKVWAGALSDAAEKIERDAADAELYRAAGEEPDPERAEFLEASARLAAERSDS